MSGKERQNGGLKHFFVKVRHKELKIFNIFGWGQLWFECMSGKERQNGDLKHFFVKVRHEELKIFNILKAYELKFEPNLGCRAAKSLDFWQISLA